MVVCQIDTEGGMYYVYILHSCIIVKSCGYISPSFMYWSKYNDVALHLDVTLSEPNASIMGSEWVLSTMSNEWGQIDIVEDDWEMYKSW